MIETESETATQHLIEALMFHLKRRKAALLTLITPESVVLIENLKLQHKGPQAVANLRQGRVKSTPILHDYLPNIMLSLSMDEVQNAFMLLTRFSDRIAQFVAVHLAQHYKPRVDLIGSYYGLSTKLSQHAHTSLKSHPLCEVSASSLSHSLGANRVPSQAVINQINKFVDWHNDLREGARRDDARKGIELIALWSKTMSCLAYVESLSTADSRTSEAISKKHAPTGYTKPPGVGNYEDPLQDEVSRLNMGLYQFTPNSSGNVQPCIRQWNEWHPCCYIDQQSSKSELIRILGRSYQSFNAFCGVSKIAKSFAIQINTTKKSSTHPANQTSGGGLKASGERCVSPFFAAGKTYNHFGPLQNSTGSNLGRLMSCVLVP